MIERKFGLVKGYDAWFGISCVLFGFIVLGCRLSSVLVQYGLAGVLHLRVSLAGFTALGFFSFHFLFFFDPGPFVPHLLKRLFS
jgi:hypothetical protein